VTVSVHKGCRAEALGETGASFFCRDGTTSMLGLPGNIQGGPGTGRIFRDRLGGGRWHDRGKFGGGVSKTK